MEFDIEVKEFLKGLKTIEKAGKFCYIEAKDDKICLKASCTIFTIITFVSAEIIEEGETLVSLQDLKKFVTKCNKKIRLRVESNKLLVENAFFRTYNPHQYLPLPTQIIDYPYYLSNFSQKLQQIMICCNKREQMFTGNIVLEGDYMYSTDSLRIGIIHCPNLNFPRIVIPSSILLCMTGWEEVYIAITSQQKMVYFTNNDTIIISQLLDIGFPVCIDVVNKYYSNIIKTIEINTSELQEICEKACIFNNFSTQFILHDNKMTVVSVGEAGSFKESLLLDTKTDMQQKFYCNPKFLVDVLRIMQEENSIISFHLCSLNGLTLILIEKEDFKYLIAPQRK